MSSEEGEDGSVSSEEGEMRVCPVRRVRWECVQ